MRPRRLFFASLAVFALLAVAYGLNRFALGVDFTDEGAYIAWPLRTLFGERPFTSELMTLLRPSEVYFTLPFQLHPAITLFEFRLLGWIGHVAAFGVLASYLFRLSGAPLQSVLVASVPLFVCHIFGLAPPSYNTLSSDFLVIALSLRGLSATNETRRPFTLEFGAGLALVLATIAHPALGLVAAVMIVYEVLARNLAHNLWRRTPSPSNFGVLVFVGCWVVLGIYFLASGAAGHWLQRLSLVHSAIGNSLQNDPVQFYLVLGSYPFRYSRIALLASALIVPVATAAIGFARRGQSELAARLATALALLLVASMIVTFACEPDFLPISLVRAAVVVVIVHAFRPRAAERSDDTGTTSLLLFSILAAVLYATFTFYFSAQRSWISGTLGLPFAFAVGLTLLMRASPTNLYFGRILPVGLIALLVGCAAREHYRRLYRDSTPADLTAVFQNPKFRGIRSTAERVDAVEKLYAQLHPQLARGEPLLAFDDCPMLYFLFDARPAYGLTWAVRYNQPPAVLRQLDAELRAAPLPRFAVRTLVDLSHPVWSTAPRTKYTNYPLNETLLARYALIRTIFPFEIWELKSPAPLEKASPGNPPP
jgi:hypothetical protein